VLKAERIHILAPVPGKKGNYVTLLARLQLSVP
jgi:hypothetical protein